MKKEFLGSQSLPSDISLSSPNRKEMIKLQQKKECIEGLLLILGFLFIFYFIYLEQKLVESCLGACFNLLSDVCRWYLKGRERDKTGVLCTITALIRDFSDFPFYSFQSSGNTNTISSICNYYFYFFLKNLLSY